MGKNNKKVAILLSTYNGEQFLREQVDSILNQSYKNLFLFIRDDGSRDCTCEIIKQYTEQYSNVIFINPTARDNIKPKYSFFELVKVAYSDSKDFDYFAFADQDDFWLEGKIQHAIDMLEEANESRFGKLYYSNKTVVDHNLNVKYEEKILYYGDYLEVLCHNMASGCTMVFDRKFCELLARHVPFYGYHDGWAYRLAKTLGSTVVFDKKSYILYRQHGGNTVGIVKQKTAKDYLRSFHLNSIVASESTHRLSNQLNEIIVTFREDLAETDNKELGEILLKYQEKFLARFKLFLYLRKNGLNKRSLGSRMIWCHRILRNRI